MGYHSNYHVESDYDYEDLYQNNYREYNRKRKKKNNFSIGIVIVIILLISIIAIISSSFYNQEPILVINEYEMLEEELVDMTRNYIVNNDITITRDSYFTLHDLGIDLGSDYSELSGVMVYRDGNYTPYLICDDYQSDIVTNDSDNIDLFGDEVMFLSNKDSFIEPGYSSNFEIKVVNYIKQDVGVYNVYYNVMANGTIFETVKRIVIVVNDELVKNMYPIISIIGGEVVYLNKGDNYLEPGYFASDSIDGDLKNKVIIENNVNTQEVGEYYIKYLVTNSRGFSKSISRQVNIIDNSISVININYYVTPTNVVNDKKTITFYVSSNDYAYTILPNGNKEFNNMINYSVYENGVYSFHVYDKNNRIVSRSIEVTGIDKSMPIVTCSAELYNGYILINANGNDSSGIASYEYLVDGKTSNPISSTSYSMTLNDAKSVRVKIIDTAGNKNEVNCSIADKRVAVVPTSPRCSDDVIYKGKKYSLTESQKIKLAKMVTAEYGSDIVGMKMVASHMANLYEHRIWSGVISSSKSLYNFITTTNWYATGTKNYSKYDSKALEAVEQCIVNGERTLPLYIDEFDWFPGDIIKDYVKDIDDYVRLKTPIKNKYGSSGTFWCVSQNSSKTDANIFFYTSDKYKKFVG